MEHCVYITFKEFLYKKQVNYPRGLNRRGGGGGVLSSSTCDFENFDNLPFVYLF